MGELIGTYLLVLFGCGSVAVSILYGEYQSVLQIAITLGIGVTLAIYTTRHLFGHILTIISYNLIYEREEYCDTVYLRFKSFVFLDYKKFKEWRTVKQNE